MSKIILSLVSFSAILLTFSLGPVAFAEKEGAFEEIAARVAKDLGQPGITAEHISKSPVDGLYQITLGTAIAYVTDDARFLIQGDVIDLKSLKNMTEVSRGDVRRSMMLDLNPKEMVVFAPKKSEHVVTVFTDFDCGYCRKLHREMEGYNDRGIEVRYMFFPRSGPGRPSWAKAENVWCAPDRLDAFTRAKMGEEPIQASCGGTPVAEHFELGQVMGVSGTPTIFLDDGTKIGGYRTPDQLLSDINSR